MSHPNFIENLAPELVQHIICYIDPASHIAFAQTCKRNLDLSRPILRRHRLAYEKYSVASDISASEILDLLWGALSSPGGAYQIEAWHVRELEIWGSRETWEEWRPWEVSQDGGIRLSDSESERPSFTREEIAYLICKLDLGVGRELSDEDVDLARTELENGQDGLIKMLLIAALPRLNELKFAHKEGDLHSSLKWLGETIRWCVKSGKWPRGYAALQKVSVGISTVPDSESGRSDMRRPAEGFSAIMRLPSISDIYFRNLFVDWEESDMDREEEEAAALYGIPASCSSVRHLRLDHCVDWDYNYETAVFRAPKCLESITMRGDNDSQFDDIDRIVSNAGERHPHSLSRILFYNPRGFHGYRCHHFLPEALHHFRALKMVTVAVGDPELVGLYDTKGNGHDELVSILSGDVYPASIEVFVLWGSLDGHLDMGDYEDLEVLDDAIVAMIESGYYRNLQAIYVDGIETDESDASDDERRHDERRDNPFPKATASSIKHGIHLHTTSSKDNQDHSVGFVAMPDKYDLKSGNFGQRNSSWVIDAYTGEWRPPRTATDVDAASN